MALRNYNSAEVYIIFNAHRLTGYMNGTFVSIDQNADSFGILVGADGDATRSKSNNRSARMEVTLQQSSPSNDVLSTFHNADLLAGGLETGVSAGVGPWLLRDNQGRTLLTALNAWIVRFAPVSYGEEDAGRVWTFETDFLAGNVGGN